MNLSGAIVADILKEKRHIRNEKKASKEITKQKVAVSYDLTDYERTWHIKGCSTTKIKNVLNTLSFDTC